MELTFSICSLILSGIATYWAFHSVRLAKESNDMAAKSVKISDESYAVTLASFEAAAKEAETLRIERIEAELVQRFCLSKDSYAHQRSIQWAIKEGLRDSERIRQIVFRTANSKDFDSEQKRSLLAATIHIDECIAGRITYPI